MVLLRACSRIRASVMRSAPSAVANSMATWYARAPARVPHGLGRVGKSKGCAYPTEGRGLTTVPTIPMSTSAGAEGRIAKPMIKLYTFGLSTFSEKVRWALDRTGVAYREERLTPGLHVPVIRRLAPRSSVPVLVQGGTAVQGSSEILDYLDTLGLEHDFSDNPDPVLSAELDRCVGEGLQTICYEHLLETPAAVKALWTQDASRLAKVGVALTYPLVSKVVRKKYCPSPERLRQAEKDFEQICRTCDERLGRHPYLCGTRPTRADLTLAALAAPLIQPKQHPFTWLTPFGPLADWLRAYLERPTLTFVSQLYQERRLSRRAPAGGEDQSRREEVRS